MPSEPRITLSLTTVADATEAERLSRTLVHEGLVACVTMLPGARSVYRWQGRMEEVSEVLLLMKHAATATPALQQRVRALHAAEVPELIHFEATGGLPSYLAWVVQAGQNEESPPTS